MADREAPHIPALPKAFEHYRYELGAEVYGSMGIPIADTARHAAAVMRNFDFFGAPLVGIVSMHRDLGPADALSVGMYLQTLILALTARELGTCVEVSVAGYRDIVRNELKIEPELTFICALAVGYTDPDFTANKLRIRARPSREGRRVPRRLVLGARRTERVPLQNRALRLAVESVEGRDQCLMGNSSEFAGKSLGEPLFQRRRRRGKATRSPFSLVDELRGIPVSWL